MDIQTSPAFIAPKPAAMAAKPKYRQREYMRKMVRELGLDQKNVCAAYAKALREGLVRRKSNRYRTTHEEYAELLWHDGLRNDQKRKPWLFG